MNPTLEDVIMAHRYMYYVLADTRLLDHEYDILERQGRSLLDEASSVHKVGSDLDSSYTQQQKDIAWKILNVTQ
jgi:NAD-dependent DNA ligase